MTAADTRTRHPDITTGMIGPFVLLTFGVTWGIVALLLFAPNLIPSFLGSMGVTNPVYILAVWAPALVAIGFLDVGQREGGHDVSAAPLT